MISVRALRGVRVCFLLRGYPNGVRATTLTPSGTFRIFFTSPSSNAPIQQVPSPSSVAINVRWSMAIARSIG